MIRNTLPLSVLCLAVSLAFFPQAQAQTASSALRDQAITRLSAETGGAAEVKMHDATGTARFIRLRQAMPMAQARRGNSFSDEGSKADSLQFLSSYGAAFGIRNAASELDAGTPYKDNIGGMHILHKQLYQGLPVFGGELKTHFNAAGLLTAANGTFIPDLQLDIKPSRSADEAGKVAMAVVASDVGPAAATASVRKSTLLIYREGLAQSVPGANHLAWQIDISNGRDVVEFAYVDAHSGKFIDKVTGIHKDLNRRAYDGANQTTPGPNYPNNPFWVEGQALPTGKAEADNMIYASEDVYKLFKNAFGRDSFDGKGATMHSIFNRGDSCPNASWSGVLGLISFCPGFTTDDVTAHEWAHAYTQYTDNLIYGWQAGALNEGYSDIWGETVDRLNGRGTDTPDGARTGAACTPARTTSAVTFTQPTALLGYRPASPASGFGPQTFNLASTPVVLVNDGVSTASDACEPTFVNAANVAGKIALVDRGTCSFPVAVKNAQLNGAVGVIVINSSNSLLTMSGTDASITIPSMLLPLSDGNLIKAQLQASAVQASLQRGPGKDNSVRWLIAEDYTGGAFRDMYNPNCFSHPGRVGDAYYNCSPNTAAGDYGGVHSNSGVVNHGYALAVDGGTYNGQVITGIGLTKAAHIYFRAQSAYQISTSGFADHADALAQSCSDLTGINLNDLKTGGPSGEIITPADCAQVAKVAQAVEFRALPTQCTSYVPVLAKSPPAQCPSGTPATLMVDTFDGGRSAGLKWVISSSGSHPEFVRRNWGVVNQLPDGRPGSAIFAVDYAGGSCAAGDDQSGVQSLESPEVTIPVGNAQPRLSFDHWIATEPAYDGGNIKISVNGGAWQVLKSSDFVYNGYNKTLAAATGPAANTNPQAGQQAFSGSDDGAFKGSWGHTIVNLSAYAKAGDRVKLRFDLSNDGCGGYKGWYLDDVTVYSCPSAN